jgi:HlyD family secretion protein
MKNKIRLWIILFTLAATTVLSAGCSSKTELQLSGTVEATQIEAASEVSGKVIRFGSEEGNSVKKGDVLAVLDSSLQELTVRQQQAIVEAKQARLDELKAGTRPQQLEQARESVKSAGLAVANGQNNVKNARITYDYWLDKYESIKKLVSAKNTMENELADAKYKVDTAKQQLDIAEKQQETLKTQLKSAESQLDLLKQGATSQSVKAAEADLEQTRLSLEQARLVLGKYQVLSPMDGTYSLRNVHIGDLINTGTSVATISDLNDLWMYVFLPQKYI